MAKKIDPHIQTILARCTIKPDRGAFALTLPAQLDRPDYVAVNKVLTNFGGKWSRRDGAHMFASDPRQALGLAVEAGAYTDKRQELQYFPTPPALAARMIALADVSSGDRVLEPSAGQGAIALGFRDGVRVDMVEIDPDNMRQLQQTLVNREGSRCDYSAWCTDFLTWAKEHDRRRYDAIVMNPPFRNNQDLAHIRAAWDLLKPGGRFVALTSPHWTFATDRASVEFNEWIADECLESEEIASGTFKASGTEIRTMLLWGPKRTAQPIAAKASETPIAADPLQTILPGAERLQEAPKPPAPVKMQPPRNRIQKSCDFGLFGEIQLDLVDHLRGA